MPSNSQARINRLKAAFQKAEELMNDGYTVLLDDNAITEFDWSDGLITSHGDYVHNVILDGDEIYADMADLTIAEINKELAERLTVWKKVEIKL